MPIEGYYKLAMLIYAQVHIYFKLIVLHNHNIC